MPQTITSTKSYHLRMTLVAVALAMMAGASQSSPYSVNKNSGAELEARRAGALRYHRGHLSEAIENCAYFTRASQDPDFVRGGASKVAVEQLLTATAQAIQACNDSRDNTLVAIACDEAAQGDQELSACNETWVAGLKSSNSREQGQRVLNLFFDMHFEAAALNSHKNRLTQLPDSRFRSQLMLQSITARGAVIGQKDALLRLNHLSRSLKSLSEADRLAMASVVKAVPALIAASKDGLRIGLELAECGMAAASVEQLDECKDKFEAQKPQMVRPVVAVELERFIAGERASPPPLLSTVDNHPKPSKLPRLLSFKDLEGRFETHHARRARHPYHLNCDARHKRAAVLTAFPPSQETQRSVSPRKLARLTEAEDLAGLARALGYARANKGVLPRDEAYRATQALLRPVLDSPSELAACADLNIGGQGTSIACRIDGPLANSTILLFYPLVSKCGDGFCGHIATTAFQGADRRVGPRARTARKKQN